MIENNGHRPEVPLRIYAAILCLVPVPSGCRQKPPETTITYAAVKGVIQEISSDRKEAVIRHERIPGYMDGMTMPFKVSDAHVMDGRGVGEQVEFELVVTPTDAYIDRMAGNHIYDTNKAGQAPDNASLVHIPQIGERIPDMELTNQDGKTTRLKDHRGKVLALNFIYTHCPLPTFCPRSMREFKTLKETLGDAFGRKVEFFTFTFDPQNDSPQTLKQYGLSYGNDSPHWQLLTGRPSEVKKAVSFFDVNYWKSDTGKITEHTMSTVLVDRQGRVARFYSGNDYDAAQLKRDIDELIANPHP